MKDTTIIPKEIIKDVDDGTEIASFSYYDGIAFAKANDLKQATTFEDVFKDTHYIVCCGDVMVKVEPTDYPELQRRPL